jgi:hypothetical protein
VELSLFLLFIAAYMLCVPGRASRAPASQQRAAQHSRTRARAARLTRLARRILYYQRDAPSAFQVTSNLVTQFVPSVTAMASISEVTDWLSGLMGSIWSDPVCGDGKCEIPFEFPTYGRFGCKADCGIFTKANNVTGVQVDFYYDFSHPAGSTPATTLLQQATWNVCPQEDSNVNGPIHDPPLAPVPHGQACYYDSDNTFSAITGHDTAVMLDVPDGLWQVVINNDLFNKVGGSSRNLAALNTAAVALKVQLAQFTVWRANYYELTLLKSMMSLFVNVTYSQFAQLVISNTLNTALASLTAGGSYNYSYTQAQANATLSQQLTQFVLTDASCVQFLPTRVVRRSLLGMPDATHTEEAADAAMEEVSFEGAERRFLSPGLLGGVVTSHSLIGAAGVVPRARPRAPPPVAFNDSGLETPAAKPGLRTLLQSGLRQSPPPPSPPPPTPYNLAAGCNCVVFNGPLDCYCDGSRDGACIAGRTLIQSGQAYAQTALRANVTGLDVTAQGLAKAELNAQLQALYDIDPTVQGAVTSAIGNDPENPSAASLTTLWSSTLADNAAASNAKSFLQARLPAGDLGYLEIVNNMNERMYELSLVAYKNVTVDFGSVNNTYVTWIGGANAYRTCDLGMRGPQYLGECTPINPQQSPFLFGGGSTAVVTTQTTDLLAICNSVCDCSLEASPSAEVNNCNSLSPVGPPLSASSPYASLVAVGTPVQAGYICSCAACEAVNLNRVKTQVQTAGRRRLMADSGAAAAAVRLAPDVLGREHPMVTRRRLLQAAGAPTTSVDTLASLVIDLASGQDSLANKVDALSDKQTSLQTQAQAYFKDTTLADMVKSGFTQMTVDHESLTKQLDKILNVQNQVLIQAQAAAAAAAQLADLATQQTLALAAVTAAVTEQLSQIQAAVTAGVLQGDAIWSLQRAAFIAQMNAEKEALLSNLPCSLVSYKNKFAIANYNNTIDPTAARYRLVGLTNRVVAGLLLYTQRTATVDCGTRFDNIDSVCPSGGLYTAPFGVDPVFKLGTTIYNSALDNPELLARYYNCSATISSPTYAEDENAVSNPYPYCNELFNAFNLPYGFYSRDIPGFTGGYPMFFDINMSYDVAQFWLSYMIEGLLLDTATTTSLTAVLLTYNGELDHFGFSRVEFTFAAGGAIQIAQSTAALRLDLYSTAGDRVRLVGEIVLAIMVAVSFLAELADMWEVYTERGSLGHFFANGWVYVDFLSIMLFVTTITLWWIIVLQHTTVFSPSLRFNVYYNVEAPANIMRLEPDPYVGANLDALGGMFLEVETIANLMQTYISLSGINIVLCLLRILKLMDFQPRLGVITHTMFLAASDLGHFFFIFSIIFIAFSLTGHLMFGYFASSFSDAGTAINTCFNNLLGDTSWFDQVQQLQGLQKFVGTAYFWIFQICMVLILLNFLLAIICDAFGEVKGSASEATSVIEEVVPMLAEYYRSFVDKNHIPESQILRQLKIWNGLEPDAADKEEEEEEPEKVVRLDGEQVPRDELIEVVRQCVVETLARTGTRRVAQPWLLSSSEQEAKAKKLVKGGDDGKTMVQAEEEASEDGFDAASTKPEGAKGRIKKQTIVSEEDIVRAADLLLDQVGEEREDEEDEEDFASLTEAMERMIAAQQRLVDGQRLVVEGQQRVATAERRIEDMHRSLNDLLAPVAGAARVNAPAADPMGALRSVIASAAANFGGRSPPAVSPPPASRGRPSGGGGGYIREVGSRSRSGDRR